MSRLFLFDLDGTLVPDFLKDTDTGLAQDPEHPYLEPNLLPAREEMIQALAKGRNRFGICTNQAGVALGHCTEDEARERVSKTLALLNFFESAPFTVQICYDHPQATVEPWAANRQNQAAQRYRKPEPGMLKTAMVMMGVPPHETVYVGDRMTDLEAAERAVCTFIHAEDFFHDPEVC